MSTPVAVGRSADSARRRQRVIRAINDAVTAGDSVSVSGIARMARVDRTFLYRHRDLLEQVHVAETQPTTTAAGRQATQAWLRTDLLNAQERAARMAARIQPLEKKLSQLLGQHAWRESGLGAPDDIDALKRRVTDLEQTVVDLTRQLEERGDELDAARAANREMIARLNSTPR